MSSMPELLSSTDVIPQGSDVHHDNPKAIRPDKWNLFYWSRDEIGQRIESFPIQLITVILIYLDFVSCAVISLLELMDAGGTLHERLQNTSTTSSNYAGIVDPVSNGHLCSSRWVCSLALYMLQSFTGFTMVYFTLETMSVVYAFGFKKISAHVGYSIDVMIVTILCLCGVFKQTPNIGRSGTNPSRIMFSSLSHAIMYCDAIRLLGCFRIWRLARLVTLVLDNSQNDLEKTQEALHLAHETIEKMNKSSSLMETSSADETFRTIQKLRNEIETLEEALRIAAVDMAAHHMALDDVEPLVSATEKVPPSLSSIAEDVEESSVLEEEESRVVVESVVVDCNVLESPSDDDSVLDQVQPVKL